MTEVAPNYQTKPTDSLEGLDSFFEVQAADVQDTVPHASGHVQDPIQVDVQDSVQEEITVIEASKLLNVDRRSVVRLLNWKKLSGRKDESGKWLVSKPSVLERLKSQDPVQDSVLVDVQDTVPQESDIILDVSNQTQTTIQDTALELVKQQSEQLKQAYTYLDAATARILYLQEQLEQKDHQIKLLTDSQYKPGWWARFCSWFIGR